MISTRDKMEFCVAMARHTPATVHDVLALMRYASAYLSAPNTARRERMVANMNKVCERLGAGILLVHLDAVYVITQDEQVKIRIPV